MYEEKLGKFLGTVEIDGSIFHVKGLTVGEYCDLVMKMKREKIPKDSERWNSLIFDVALVDWENVFTEDGEEFHFSSENRAYIDGESVFKIAKYCYDELTVLSDEERSKFQASIRFLYFCSEPKHENIVKTFDCQTCILKGLARTRMCGRFSDEQIEELGRQLRNEEEEASEASKIANKDMTSKYKTNRSRVKPTVAEKPVEQRSVLMLDGYKYPECPVSYVDEWISLLTGMLYHAGKSNLPFFGGGVVDQPYKLLQAQKVVSGEASAIEREEMEKDRKEMERSSKKGRK
jgi:hypothetical protein